MQNLWHECKLQMVSDWLKTQKKVPRTNQILAVLTIKFKKMAMVFCTLAGPKQVGESRGYATLFL